MNRTNYMKRKWCCWYLCYPQ